MQTKYSVGQFAELKHVFTTDSVVSFAQISTDINPVHLDEEFASKTVFGRRIVHGMFVSSLFSALIANKLPGPGSIYLAQDLSFLKPVFHDEEITARVEIIEIRDDKPIIKLNTIATNQKNEIVVKGIAVVKIL